MPPANTPKPLKLLGMDHGLGILALLGHVRCTPDSTREALSGLDRERTDLHDSTVHQLDIGCEHEHGVEVVTLPEPNRCERIS